MKKKLLNLTFIVIAGINVFMFYGFSDSGRTHSCGNPGREIGAWIRIQLPQSFGSNYEKCGYSGNDFSFNNLTYVEQWYMTIQVTYGNPTLYDTKYGQLPNALGSGIRKYDITGCTEEGYVLSGSFPCNEFPINLQTEHSNTITVRISTPCGEVNPGFRSQAAYSMTFNVSAGNAGSTFFLDDADFAWSPWHFSSCNPCL